MHYPCVSSFPFSPCCPYLNNSLAITSPLLCREYLLEVKVRLLEQLSCGFNSPQLAIEFIQMLLEEYSSLCNSLPSLLYLLEPLVRPTSHGRERGREGGGGERVSVCVCERERERERERQRERERALCTT